MVKNPKFNPLWPFPAPNSQQTVKNKETQFTENKDENKDNDNVKSEK